MDAGLYYNGDDMQEAKRVQDEIAGALYGYFQDGARRSVTKMKREEDNQHVTYTAMPMDKWNDKQEPQVSFVVHKNLGKGNPVIGIHLNV